MAYKLIGKTYATPDLVAKVTGRAKYAEDFRAEGMLFAKLLVSPMPHGRVTRLDTRAAEALPGGGGDPDGGRPAGGGGPERGGADERAAV